MSIGRTRTLALRWSLGSMSIVVKGYAIYALTNAGGRIVTSLWRRILWVLPLCVLAQQKAWSPSMSCCLLHFHNISWGKIGSRNLLLAISWKSVGDSLCVIGCFGSLPLLGTTLLMRRYLVVDVGWCVGLRKIRNRRCRGVCVVLPFLLEEKESTLLTLTSVINTPVRLASYCWKPLETSCFSCPVVGGPAP